jgi:hypothetical protein
MIVVPSYTLHTELQSLRHDVTMHGCACRPDHDVGGQPVFCTVPECGQPASSTRTLASRSACDPGLLRGHDTASFRLTPTHTARAWNFEDQHMVSAPSAPIAPIAVPTLGPLGASLQRWTQTSLPLDAPHSSATGSGVCEYFVPLTRSSAGTPIDSEPLIALPTHLERNESPFVAPPSEVSSDRSRHYRQQSAMPDDSNRHAGAGILDNRRTQSFSARPQRHHGALLIPVSHLLASCTLHAVESG